MLVGMPAQTVVTKKKSPSDRKPKADKPKAPANPPIIDIEDEGEDIPVRLVGIDYQAHRPKAMLAVRLGERVRNANMDDPDEVESSFGGFLNLTFGTVTSAAIMARLVDPDDKLDVHHLLRFVERITEVVTGRPPTSPPASDS